MWIQMKTFKIISEDDICKVLVANNLEQLNNIFELKMKDIEKQRVYKTDHQEIISFKASMVLLTLQKSNSSISLSRKNYKNYFVHFVNIKNEKGEMFTSFVDNLHENYRFLLIDGIVMKSSKSLFNDTLTITIRPENNSSVILLKCGSLSLKNTIIEKNLAQLIGPGCYSLWGIVIKTMKYTDEDFMLLRIQCFDKSCIKTYKYPNCISEFKNVLKKIEENDVEYDFSSKTVDILVKNPCINFISLVSDQRIVLNNVKVKYSNDLKLFLLYMKGHINNLRADPVETISLKSLRPPMKVFPLPDDLKLAVKPIKKPTFSGSPLFSNNRPSIHDRMELSDTSDDSVPLLPITHDFVSSEHVNNKETDVNKDVDNLFHKNYNGVPTKNMKVKSQIDNMQLKPSRDIDLYDSSDSFTDDNVNLSPCQYFSTPKSVHNKKTDVNIDVCQDLVPTKITKSKSNINKSINLLNEHTSSKQIKISTLKENSPDSFSSSSCSPLFFDTPSEVITAIPENQSKNLQLSNVKMDSKTQCIGPCRLIYIEPSMFDDEIIVSGYCTKCMTFIQKSFVKYSNMEYRCPKCSNIVHLTFFLKMFFLYGKNYGQAIEVCCYNDNAKRVFKKLTKKNITLESYLSNQNCRVLVVDTLKSLIINKTKVNIIVCESVTDKTNILLSIDTKYVVTTPMY